MDFSLKNMVVWGRKGNNIEQGSWDLEGQLEESELTAHGRLETGMVFGVDECNTPSNVLGREFC